MSTVANRIARLEQAHRTGIESWTEEQVDARIAELEPRFRAELKRAGINHSGLSLFELVPHLKRSIAADPTAQRYMP